MSVESTVRAVTTLRLSEMKQYLSHSDITVYTHSVKVAYTAYRFAIELGIAKRYEGAKNAIISAGISGIEHPHYTECYYVLACHMTEADFS